MPIYEYTCQGCGAHFEQLQRSVSHEVKPKCPTCGSPKTNRALSLFAVGSESGGKGSAGASSAPICGRCGEAPGSCSA